ncbi:16S rRNA (guanine(966)-N(2))-methyltransferase RsmD [Lachnotalea glycerini]|uniref:16S rRNA (guanine(966)-N(2))-methyltransferase RsmD n=1 Tax=Lachnotalea glycerini TaxID=1763509 RepID=UPI002E8E4548|nr:16S rRNA (guanine(966)-N(2))-methyltransferase RsmD [Lachnotalea glycerini]
MKKTKNERENKVRVIAGQARRINLKTIPGMDTRPTSDRIKETLFNMIHSYLTDICFLDLFAGSGQMGIEALSRGAKQAIFVESNKGAVSCIEQNLELTKLKDKSKVICQNVIPALMRLEGNYHFEYVFMDPPYHVFLEKQVLEYLKNSSLIDSDSVIIVEASLETKFDYLENLGFQIIKRKEYKTNMHLFLQMQ